MALRAVAAAERHRGQFDGVVAAAIDLEAFDRLYRTIDLDDGGFITLLSSNGTLITRMPDPGNARGRKFPGGVIMTGRHREGRFDGWTTSPISGEQVLLAAHAVRGFPLLVASGSNEAAVLAPWRDEAWLVFDRTLLTSAAMLGADRLAAWGLARRERALARSWRRYQSMIEHSSDALILSRPTKGGILYASPAIERLLGYRMDELQGREVMDYIHPEYLEIAMKARAELLRTPGQGVGRRVQDGAQGRLVALDRAHALEPAGRAERARGGVQFPRHHRAQAGRGRARAARAAAAPGGEARGGRAARRRHRARLQQHPRRHPRLRRDARRERAAGSPLKRYADNVLSGANRASGLVEQILSYSRSQRGKRARWSSAASSPRRSSWCAARCRTASRWK